jgi:hypothetical protein
MTMRGVTRKISRKKDVWERENRNRTKERGQSFTNEIPHKLSGYRSLEPRKRGAGVL